MLFGMMLPAKGSRIRGRLSGGHGPCRVGIVNLPVSDRLSGPVHQGSVLAGGVWSGCLSSSQEARKIPAQLRSGWNIVELRACLRGPEPLPVTKEIRVRFLPSYLRSKTVPPPL